MEDFLSVTGIITLYCMGGAFTTPFITYLNEEHGLADGPTLASIIFWPIFIPMALAFVVGNLILNFILKILRGLE